MYRYIWTASTYLIKDWILKPFPVIKLWCNKNELNTIRVYTLNLSFYNIHLQTDELDTEIFKYITLTEVKIPLP